MSTPVLYGTSWEQLAHRQTWFHPADAKAAEQNMVSFMQIIAERWYRLHHDAVRRHDRHHLTLSNLLPCEGLRPIKFAMKLTTKIGESCSS